MEDEPLAILLLPSRLDEFELADHARDLLSIPRVAALEPSRVRTPGFLRESLPLRQARRLRFPGTPRVVVLYGPRQYPLARALIGRHEHAELWHVDTGIAFGDDPEGELAELDRLARLRANATFAVDGAPPAVANEPLRRRMIELEIISSRPFIPGAKIPRR